MTSRWGGGSGHSRRVVTVTGQGSGERLEGSWGACAFAKQRVKAGEYGNRVYFPVPRVQGSVFDVDKAYRVLG